MSATPEDVRQFYERRLREEWHEAGGTVSGSFFHHPELPGLTGDSRSAWAHLVRALYRRIEDMELQHKDDMERACHE